jgi:hypothetical protein
MGQTQKISGSNAQQKPPSPVCLPKMNPFFANLAVYQNMAKTLNTNADFLMALSSMESGWLDPHNQGLHNLFGVTEAGGNNLSFPTYQAAADYWVKVFGKYVQNTTSMDSFVAGLRAAGYNSVNKNYDQELKRQLSAVMKYKTACGIK